MSTVVNITIGPYIQSGTSSNTPNRKVGKTYNKSTWTDLSDFSTNLAGATVSGGKILIPNGAVADFTKPLSLSQYSCISNWKMEMIFQLTTPISASTNGISIGIQSGNSNSLCSIAVFFNCLTGTAGKLQLFAQANATTATAWTTITDSATNLTFVANDLIKLSLERSNQKLIMRAKNLTQLNVNPVILEYTIPYNATNIIPPNTGQYTVYSHAGSYTISNLTVWNNEVFESDTMLIGDSKTMGYGSTSFYNTYPGILGKSYSDLVISGGFGDKSTDILRRIPEIIQIKPKYALISFYSNDKRFGISDATFLANYADFVQQLDTEGIQVIHLSPTYESAQDNSSVAATLKATYTPYIDIFDLPKSPQLLYADGIHWTDLTCNWVADTIKSSDNLRGSKTDQYYYNI